MRWIVALALLGAAVLARMYGQGPFEDLRTHASVGNVLLSGEPSPSAAVARHAIALAGQAFRAYLLPVALLLLAATRLREPSQWPRQASWMVVVAAVVVPLLVAWRCHLFFPFAGDEFSYLFQARCFALGMGSAPSPPCPEYYACNNLINDGQWYSIYPPGWPWVLSLGDQLGLAWLVPPLLGAVALLMVFLAARSAFGTEAASVSCALVLASPAFTMNAASYFPHVALVACVAGALWLFLESRPGRLLAPCLCGVLVGLAIDVRPPDGLLLAGMLLVLHLALRRPWTPQLGLVPLCAGLVSLALLAANLHATGTPWAGGYSLDYGHGILDFKATGHTAWSALWNSVFLLVRTLAWQVPLVLELAILAAWRGGTLERWLAAYFAVTVAAYALYFNLGQVEFGARYFLAAWTVAAIGAGALLARRPAWVLGLLLFAAAGMWPGFWRASEAVHRDGASLAAWMQSAAGADGVVFIRSTPDHFAAYFNRNLPDFSDGPRRLLFLDPTRNRRVLRTLPASRALILDFDRSTGFALHPFDHAFPPGTDEIIAGINYDQSARDPDSALRTWREIPPTSPQYSAARLNIERLLRRTGRSR